MRVRRARTFGLTCALALAVTMGVSGCVGQSASAGEPAGTARFYDQKLTWKPCDGAFECAAVTVPEDWSKPGGATIHVGLTKAAALSGQPKGTIIFNPGGPGLPASASTRAPTFGLDAEIASGYDVVGYDPPGVGRATPVNCGPGADLGKELFEPNPHPVDSAAWVSAYTKAGREFAQRCIKDSARGLLNHVDTVSAARDLDVVRAALGQKRLDYLGYSYGTDLGLVYEALFPAHIGRVVLDGVKDPLADPVETSVAVAGAYEKDLDDYLSACGSRPDCPFSGSLDQMHATLQSFLSGLDAHPLSTSSGFELDGSWATSGILDALLSQSAFTTELLELDNDLGEAMDGAGDGLLTLAEDSVSWTPADTGDSLYAPNLAINCADRWLPTTASTMSAEAAKLTAAAPVLGPYLSYDGTSCTGFPTAPKRFTEKSTPRPANTVLIVSATGDPATPNSDALAVHARMANSRLLIRDGDGHTSYGDGNTCIDNAVDGYLEKGTLPKDNTHC